MVLSNVRRAAAGSKLLSLQHAVALPQAGLTARQWKAGVDKAIEAVSILTIVGQAAFQLFDWYRLASKDEEERFRNPPTKDGFQSDVALLRTVLSNVRQDSRISASELTQVTTAHERIERDLAVSQPGNGTTTTGRIGSPLRNAIDFFQPAIRKKVIEEMRSADKRLVNECGAIWSAFADELEGRSDADVDDLVLADPHLLAEILWNLFTNVRYGLTNRKDGGSGVENSSKVDCRITVLEPNEAIGGERAKLRIEVISPAKDATEGPNRTNTWFRHEQEIKRYGGDLVYEPGAQVTASLNLIRMRRVDNGHNI